MDIQIIKVEQLDNDMLNMFKNLLNEESEIGEFFDLIDLKNIDTAIEDFFNKILDRPNNGVFKAVVNDITVGFVIGGMMTRPPYHKIRILGFIEDLYVKPEYRNNGIGTKLIKHIEKFLSYKGIEDYTLFVLHQNYKTKLFYEKVGYKIDCIKLSKKLS